MISHSITISPVSLEERMVLTRKQLKTIRKLTKDESFEYELVGHNPSATVELYATPHGARTPGTAYRHHISADGTYDSEQCEVPEDDGDWDWAPEGGWVDGPSIDWAEAVRLGQTGLPPKVKKRKKQYLSDKFTVLPNPNAEWDQQFSYEEAMQYPLNRVWTVVEGDSGKLWALTGFHIVNKLHYAITEQPWTEEDEGVDYKW